MACQHALLAGSVKSGQFLVRTLVRQPQASSGFTTAVASMLTATSEPATWRSNPGGCREFQKKADSFWSAPWCDKLQASSGFTTAVASMLTANSEPAFWRSTPGGRCEFAKSGQFLVRTLLGQTASL
jgi:hypothetical protein